jgi:hypothetical protein
MRSPLLVVVLALPVVTSGVASAGEPLPAAAPVVFSSPLRMNDLVRMNRCELEALYRQAEVGCPPCGVTRGRAIFNPGSRLTVPASRVTRVLWQGKVFKDDGMMVNRVLGVRAVQARVYPGQSWLDGNPSLVLDYKGASRLFPNVRDEIREVSPGLYLGIMYVVRDAGPELATYFALEARRP